MQAVTPAGAGFHPAKSRGPAQIRYSYLLGARLIERVFFFETPDVAAKRFVLHDAGGWH